MHRQSVSRLANFTSTSSSTVSKGTRRYKSDATNRKPPPSTYSTKPAREGPVPFRLTKQKYDRIEQTVKGFAAAASQKKTRPGWGPERVFDNEARRLENAVRSYKNASTVPSPEMQVFMSEPTDTQCDPQSASPQFEYTGQQKILPGTLVEIRRSEAVIHGVMLYEATETNNRAMYSLTVTGEVWGHSDADVVFSVPSFIPGDLVTRCGVGQVAQNDREIAARVQVLRKLRDFDVTFERRSIELAPRLKHLYANVRHPDPNEWNSITADQANAFINPNPDNLPPETQLAVHAYLFGKPKYFAAQPTNFMATKSFWVRPQQQVDDIDAVDAMIARDDPLLDSFLQKARHLIASSRARDSEGKAGVLVYREDTSTQFTRDEMSIIRYLRDSIHPRRSFQKDPYVVSLSTIIKKSGMYSDLDIDDSVVHKFLMELGVLPPWEDVVTREQTLWRRWSMKQPFEAMDDLLSKASSITSVPPARSQPLGPEDFYTHDLVESLRHDFGSMPVYVADDVDAEELDDGISAEPIPSEPGNVWLHVHIADPTAILPPTHAASRRALETLETSYFVDRSTPMLPAIGPLENLSLRSSQGSPQNVMSFSAKVDKEGEIIEYKVRPGIVRNVHLLRYDDVNVSMGWGVPQPRSPFGRVEGPERYINPSPIPQSVKDDISFIKDITRSLALGRLKHGALSFTRPIANITFQPRPLPQTPPVSSTPFIWSGFPDLRYEVQYPSAVEFGSRGMVAEAMRTAGRVASRFFKDRGISAIRRVASQPLHGQGGVLSEMMALRDEYGFVDYFDAIAKGNLYGLAEYTIHPGAHVILGISEDEGYARVTSPLRRFADMLAHWQIKHALLSPAASSRMFTDEWLSEFARYMGTSEQMKKRAKSSQQQYWAHQFLLRWQRDRHKRHADTPDPLDSLVARVLEIPVANIRRQYYQQAVYLPDLGLNAVLKGLEKPEGYPVASSVDVKIDDIRLGLRPLLTVVRR